MYTIDVPTFAPQGTFIKSKAYVMELERPAKRRAVLTAATDLLFSGVERAALMGVLEFSRRQLDGASEVILTGLLMVLMLAFLWWTSNQAMDLATQVLGESRWAGYAGVAVGFALASVLQLGMFALVGEAADYL